MYRPLLSVVVCAWAITPIGCGRTETPSAPRLTIAIPSGVGESVRQALEAFNSAEPLGRAQALSALYESAANREFAVSSCVTALEDPNYLVRARAAELLGQSEDPSAIDPLLKTLDNQAQNDRVRSTAAEALGRLKAGQATQTLIGMLRDTVWHVRYQAVVALGRIGDESAAEPLREMATYEANEFVSEAIQESLRQLSDADDAQ